MGRASKEKNCLNSPFLPFDRTEIEPVALWNGKNGKGLSCPLWTQNKALLIKEYIKLFTYITKHGIYIDGFAAPQRRNHESKCSARLVLENKPQWVRDFWLCDIDPKGIELLEEIKSELGKNAKNVNILLGDFNKNVDNILSSGTITEKKATFALLDQRTFECEWRTVQKLAAHKKGTKIEIFYFFPTGWIDRSIAAIKTLGATQTAERWWGKEDWRALKGMQSVERANLVAQRFRDELGYRSAFPLAIHDSSKGGRTMYHMIHASDHDEAASLMRRAYRKVSGLRDWDKPATQTDIEDFIRTMQL